MHFILAQCPSRDSIERWESATYERTNTCAFGKWVPGSVAGWGYSGNRLYGTSRTRPELHQRRMEILRKIKRRQRRGQASPCRSEKHRTSSGQDSVRRDELGGFIWGQRSWPCPLWRVKPVFAKSIPTQSSKTTQVDGYWPNQPQLDSRPQKTPEIARTVAATHPARRGVGCLIASALYPVAEGFCFAIRRGGQGA